MLKVPETNEEEIQDDIGHEEEVGFKSYDL